MRTTEVIIEVFVGGTLVLVAIVFALRSWSPGEAGRLLCYDMKNLVSSFGLVTTAVLGAFAYATGIIAEFVARRLFEWRLDQVKLARFEEFREKNSGLLEADPLLGPYYRDLPRRQPQSKGEKKKRKKTVKHLIGLMRFGIMQRSPDLSHAVESHVKRMRVLRMLALVQVLFLVGLLVSILGTPSWDLGVVCLLVLGIVVVTCFGIQDRFDRYCREIERGFLVLRLEPPATGSQKQAL